MKHALPGTGVMIALIGLGLLSWSRRESLPPPAATPTKIDLNAASAVELTLLPGIGPGRADRIVASRRERGTFSTIDDLQRVDGIGPLTIEGIRSHVRVDGD